MHPRDNPSHTSSPLLALEPEKRSTVVVLPDEAIARLNEPSATERLKDRFLTAAAVAGRQRDDEENPQTDKATGLAAGAVSAAGVAAVVAVSPVLLGGAAGMAATVMLLDRKKKVPDGVLVLSQEAARGMDTSDGPPRLRRLYAIHPVDSDRYVPYGRYPFDLLRERAREAECFFLHCGASRIELTVEYGEDLNLSGGVGYKEPRFSFRAKANAQRRKTSTRASVVTARGYRRPRSYHPQDWTWANVEPDWLTLREKRARYRIESDELSTIIEEDRSLSANLAAGLPKVAEIDLGGSVRKLETTKWVWHVTFPS